MKTLVTGATGFLGSWIVRELLERGHTVRALVRKSSDLSNIANLAVERAEGDVVDRASLTSALGGCDAVVHTAGVAHFHPSARERMYTVNAGSVRTVLEVARETGVKRALLTSSVASMGGTREPELLDERSPSRAEGSGVDYFISKHRGERTAIDLAGGGLEVVVLRPSVLLGPGDIYHSSTHTFLALARKKLPVFVRGGSSFCDVRDVASAHVTALESGAAGEIYILGGTNLDISEMVKRVSAVTGVSPPRRVPFAFAFAMATLIEGASKLVGKTSDLTRQLVKASSYYTFVSSEKAKEHLGYEIRPFEDSLRDTLRFFLSRGKLRPSTPELEALAS